MISSRLSTSFSLLILNWKTQALTQHIFKDKVVFCCLSSVQFWYLQLDAYPRFFNVRLSALMAFILSLETLAFFSLLLRSLVSAKKIQTYFSKEIICCRIVLTISKQGKIKRHQKASLKFEKNLGYAPSSWQVILTPW